MSDAPNESTKEGEMKEGAMKKGNGSGKVESTPNVTEAPANGNQSSANGNQASRLGATFERARQLVNQHPVGIVFVAAGAGALYAAERAVGALGEAGGRKLFRGATAPQLRDQLRQQREELAQETRQRGEKLKQQGEQLFARGKTQSQQLFARGKSQGEQLLRRGRSAWPFGRRPQEPSRPTQV
jgi:hypothetical protein